MSDGVWIKYTELSQVNQKLKDIVTELEDAGSRTDELRDAIDKPFGRAQLSNAVHDFESRWDDRRRDLARDIKKVQEHVQGVLDGVKDWDTQAAAQFELDVSGEHTQPRRI